MNKFYCLYLEAAIQSKERHFKINIGDDNSDKTPVQGQQWIISRKYLSFKYFMFTEKKKLSVGI